MARFGPYSFINILLFSVALLALFPFGTNTAGLALLLLTFLLSSRIVWLFDSLFARRPKTISNNMLPFILLAGMERRRTRDLIEKAHAVFNQPLYYWFLASCFFGCTYIYVSLNQSLYPTDAAMAVSQFLDDEGIRMNSFNRLYIQNTMIEVAHMAVIMIAFMLGQFYAYTHKNLQILWSAPLALFLLQMLTYLTFYGFGTPDMPSGLEVLPYLLGFIVLWPLIENLKKEKPRSHYAKLGFLVLLFFVLCDVFIALPAHSPALWLCGWVSLAALWVRAMGDKVKTYLLY